MALYELRTYTLYVGKMAEATKDSRVVVRIRARCGLDMLYNCHYCCVGLK